MSRWNPESILALTRAFMESRIALTATELDLFTLLSDTPKSLDEISVALHSDRRATEILLDALSAMELLTKKDGRYQCPQELVPFLSANSPGAVLPMMRHAAGLWKRWTELTNIVRNGATERPKGVFDEQTELEAFIGAMHVVGKNAATAIAEQAKAEASTKLLDIGGATGTYAEAFVKRYHAMHATIFDLPRVIELARKRIANAGLLDRIAFAPGDFYTDQLPTGHDLALLSAIIHQNSPQQNLELYRRIHRALEPGGRILIRDHVMSPDRTHPPGGAIFAINMLAATTGGNCYTLEEIRQTLETAGFKNVRQLQSGETMNALVEAFKR